jgi:hypothetical protein
MLFLAVGGPLVGLILGTMIGAHKRCAVPTIIAGTLIGTLCSVAYGMWRLYGAITNALGLGSAVNLVLELVIFAICGVAIGMTAAKVASALKKVM